MPHPHDTGHANRIGLLGWIGRACYRHRVITVAAWLTGVACLVVLWTQFGAAASTSFGTSDPGQGILNKHFAAQSGDALTLAIRSRAPITAPAVRAQVTQALAPFASAPHVTSVASPYALSGHISRDGHIAFTAVQFDQPSASIPGGEATVLMNDATAASHGGVTFSLGGDLVDQAETAYGGASDGIGVGAAMIVLLIAFGSLLAMALPVATALFGIGAGLSLTALLGHVFPAPAFSSIIAALIGLGVGVDYALFVVTRYRESLHAGATPEVAAITAMRTAGRSVLIAGTTVVIGLFGLLVLRQQLMTGVAVAAAVTVAITVLASLTLLPALFGFTGTRLAKPSRLTRQGRRAAAGSYSAAERWAGAIQRHPVIAATLSLAFLLVLAAPALGMKLNMPDESAQGRGTMGYASYSTMVRGFGPGFDAPLIVAAALPSASTSTTALATAIRTTPGVAYTTPVIVSRDGQAAMMIAYPATGAQNPATNTLANQISNAVIPGATAGTGIRAYLTGPNEGAVTFADQIGQKLPWLIGIVIVLGMLLLLVVFRSVMIAVKAAIMNLLSILSAYGVLVMVVQNGWLHSLFGFPEAMPVTTWVPMFLFVILFGLSMDYEVFLMSRIREEWDRTGDNAFAVARGLAKTARVISAAAAIMVVVFLSNVLGADVSVKQIGLGLAVAVLLDATVVRLVLVPAVMELLGRANWWLPRPLARILPHPPAPGTAGVPAEPTGPVPASRG
ncbi:MAG TPA: MMPL family transporter [Streptosporangiaceae bacterium]